MKIRFLLVLYSLGKIYITGLLVVVNPKIELRAGGFVGETFVTSNFLQFGLFT